VTSGGVVTIPHFAYLKEDTQRYDVLRNLLHNLASYTLAAAVEEGYAIMSVTAKVLYAVRILISKYFLITLT
jgi:hypothetical protein